MHCCALLSGSIAILFMCISCLFCEQINGYGYGYVFLIKNSCVKKKKHKFTNVSLCLQTNAIFTWASIVGKMFAKVICEVGVRTTGPLL